MTICDVILKVMKNAFIYYIKIRGEDDEKETQLNFWLQNLRQSIV